MEDLERIRKSSEGIDSIRSDQEWLAAAGGFDATLDSLDEIVCEIRAQTGTSNEDRET